MNPKFSKPLLFGSLLTLTCAQNVYKIREIVKILKCQIAVVALHPVKSRKKERKMKRGMFSTSF